MGEAKYGNTTASLVTVEILQFFFFFLINKYTILKIWVNSYAEGGKNSKLKFVKNLEFLKQWKMY